MSNKSSSVGGAAIAVGAVLGVIFVIWLLIFGLNLLSARETPQAGEIGVVRDGPSCLWIPSCFNDHNIRTVITPGSGSTFIGLGSSSHFYPADSVQRNYTITSDPNRGDRPGVDVVEVPTADSVRVGLDGTFYFTTAFNGGPQGKTLAKDFDNRFGVRTFQVVGANGNTELHPWEGRDGWSAFLDTVIRPIIDNDLRRSISNVQCAQLVASCALVHQQTAAALRNGGGANSAQIQQIQDQINASLQADIKQTLGQDYFSHVRFLLAKVTLPDAIQNEIDTAQANYASVASAKAQVEKNHQLALAKAELQHAYHNCPTCAVIDEFKALPSNLNTLALGSNSGLAITPTGK